MSTTTIKRKALRNRVKAKKRKEAIKRLSTKPTLKNIDLDAAKSSFKKSGARKVVNKIEEEVKQENLQAVAAKPEAVVKEKQESKEAVKPETAEKEKSKAEEAKKPVAKSAEKQ